MKQGDNLDSILFIVVMQFLAELLGKKWRKNNIKMIPFHHNSNCCNKDSKLISHKLKDKCFTTDELFLCLCVDDGALPFLSRSGALLGFEIIYREMSRLGLTIHVGRGDKESKTEAVFFPSRSKIQSWIFDHENNFLTGHT